MEQFPPLEVIVRLGFDTMFCKECGEEISDRAAICMNCGVPTKINSGKLNRTTYILLALFLGGIGGHKFYEGKVGMGILYIVLCWTLVPAFIALVEACMATSKTDARFE